MNKTREELIQTAVGRIMSVMHYARHHGPPPPPPGGILLSAPQAMLLFTIAHQPGSISVKDLAEKVGVTPGAVTQLVNALVEKGLVQREGDPADRRVVRLKVTKKATDQFEKFRREHLAAYQPIFDVLSDDDLRQLIALMDKIEAGQSGQDKFHAETD